MSDLITKLQSTAEQIRQIQVQVPDELTDETSGVFRQILERVGDFYFELYAFVDDIQFVRPSEAKIRFREVISSQNVNDANFYAVLVALRTICQSARSFNFFDAQSINYIAQLITRLKNNLLPSLANELDKIVQLLEEEPYTLQIKKTN